MFSREMLTARRTSPYALQPYGFTARLCAALALARGWAQAARKKTKTLRELSALASGAEPVGSGSLLSGSGFQFRVIELGLG